MKREGGGYSWKIGKDSSAKIFKTENEAIAAAKAAIAAR